MTVNAKPARRSTLGAQAVLRVSAHLGTLEPQGILGHG